MKLKIFIITTVSLLGAVSCTKLDQKLSGSVVYVPSASNAGSVLNATYNDFSGIMHGQDQMFSLQENTSDESLVPTRGGDWDDNGVWRVLHAHTWAPTHGQFISLFNGLGKMESDALTTLASSPTALQSDEALFLLSVSQFYFLDLFGQVPYRAVADYNSIKPAPVYTPADAVNNIITNLNGIISRNILPLSNIPYRANIDAVKFLLMKVLLNKGAFLNKAAPTFADADMQQVITLGNQLITSGRYSLTANYFDNFGPNNATTGKEAIWSWPNNGSSNPQPGINSGGINARWMMTLHYNSWDVGGTYGGAGWNGFSTVADFYNSFEGHGDGTPTTVIDTTKDKRIGGKYYAGVTNQSGLRPGLLAGQQKNEAGVNEVDRQGHPLTFTPVVNLVETNAATLELAGIRIVKYAPDYNAYNGGNQRNQLQFFRYADVMLMVAEAYLRQATPNSVAALALVNTLRTTRGASVWATVPLVNTANVADPATLLAERSRELYWESWRRQDLIRFGVYLKAWALKAADADTKNLLFAIPSDQLVANPNLKQNAGY
jgi:starch-binding outer membrane protein, SusD/RagB family